MHFCWKIQSLLPLLIHWSTCLLSNCATVVAHIILVTVNEDEFGKHESQAAVRLHLWVLGLLTFRCHTL